MTTKEKRKTAMNREIIFRGKRCDNGEWVYGYYFSKLGISYILEEAYERYGEEQPVKTNHEYRVQADTVGQYIELTDKSNEKIYDGDIIEYTHSLPRIIGCKTVEQVEKGYISYLTQEAGFVLILPDRDIRIGDGNISRLCFRVIGNITDTPELLKGE